MNHLHETTTHYNMQVDFFKKFLDPYMKYTSGLYDQSAATLEAAIVNMLDRIIEVAKLPANSSVLDIGSGWGALCRRLYELRPDVQYCAVSPSSEQNAYISGLAFPKSTLVTNTFEAADLGDLQFDAIFLIGSYCHLADKKAALMKMQSHLKSMGRIVIEDSFFINEELFQKHRDHPATQFVQQEIFGFAEIGVLGSQIELFAKSGFIPEYLLEHSSSYRATIAEWHQRIGKDGVMESKFQKYFEIFQKGWDRTISNHLITLRRYNWETKS